MPAQPQQQRFRAVPVVQQQPIPIPVVVDPVPVRAAPSAPRRAAPRPQQAPRAGKSIDVEGTTFNNNSPDASGNYAFRYKKKKLRIW